MAMFCVIEQWSRLCSIDYGQFNTNPNLNPNTNRNTLGMGGVYPVNNIILYIIILYIIYTYTKNTTRMESLDTPPQYYSWSPLLQHQYCRSRTLPLVLVIQFEGSCITEIMPSCAHWVAVRKVPIFLSEVD